MKKKKIDRRRKFQVGDKVIIAKEALCPRNFKPGLIVTITAYVSHYFWPYEVKKYNGCTGVFSAKELRHKQKLFN